MICFFYFTQSLKISSKNQEHIFKGVKDKDHVSPEELYFSTPSNFHNHINNIKNNVGDKSNDLVYIVDGQMVSSLEGFPTNIGFQEFSIIDQFKGKQELKIAIINSMSNSIGDHLIGMQAFDYWFDRIKEKLDGTNVVISFFQTNPYELVDITKQWQQKISHIYELPSNVAKIFEQDAFIDLGTLLLRDGFDTENMIDFFFKSLSIDPKSVPNNKKRIKYKTCEESDDKICKLISKIRKDDNPILLFHSISSDPIRQMDDEIAIKTINEIIEKSNYTVVSVIPLNIENERFIDISSFSNSIDDFASIISQVDSIITVDTCTYHIADSFDTPTVVLFTSIDPDLRCRYYPNVIPIMYEEKDGILYGKHKQSSDEKEQKKEIEHLSTLWSKLNVDEILHKLKECHGRSQTSDN